MKFLAILLIVLMPVVSFGYEIATTETGAQIHWTATTEIVVTLDPSLETINDSAYDLAEDSFNEWLDYMEGAVTVKFIKKTCTENTRYCIRYGAKEDNCGEKTVACTIRTFYTKSGSIAGVDIVMFDNYSWDSNEELHNVLLHEIGHGFGLHHSLSTTAVMYPLVSSENTELYEDDINGIMTLYTEDEYPTVEDPPQPVEHLSGTSCAVSVPGNKIINLFILLF